MEALPLIRKIVGSDQLRARRQGEMIAESPTLHLSRPPQLLKVLSPTRG
jgi:hypothetical protein